MQGGYAYLPGKRLSSAGKNKATELFRVVLTEEQRKPTGHEDILMVHAAVGPLVNSVVQRFAAQLDGRFIAWE